METGIERTWNYLEARNLRGRPKNTTYPTEAGIKTMLRVCSGISKRRDAARSAITFCALILHKLANANSGQIRLSAKALSRMPGASTSSTRPTYYKDLLYLLEDAQLIVRGRRYRARRLCSSGKARNRVSCLPAQHLYPYSKSLTRRFDAVDEAPDPDVLLTEALGDAHAAKFLPGQWLLAALSGEVEKA